MRKLVRILTLVFCFALVATLASCAPKDAAAAKKKLEKKDYTVSVLEGNALKASATLLGFDDLEAIVTGTKKQGDDKDDLVVVGYLFEDAKAAKAAFDQVKKDAEKNDSDAVTKQVGKWIISGSEKKAFKALA